MTAALNYLALLALTALIYWGLHTRNGFSWFHIILLPVILMCFAMPIWLGVLLFIDSLRKKKPNSTQPSSNPANFLKNEKLYATHEIEQERECMKDLDKTLPTAPAAPVSRPTETFEQAAKRTPSESSTELEKANAEIDRLRAEIQQLKTPKKDKDKFTPTPEYLQCINEIKKGNPTIFLTGKAGTGKSTCIQQIRKHCGKRNIVVAFTGVAALTAQGQTIHSFFQFPHDPLTENLIRRVRNPDRLDLLNKLELLIIDEISMVRCDLLDGINWYLQKNRRNGKDKPFGGIQLLFVGDPFQLPPIASRENGEQQSLRDYGYNDFFFFNSKVWKKIDPVVTIDLQKNFRQSEKNNSTEFITALNLVREGENTEKAVQMINAYCAVRPAPEGRSILTCLKDTAQSININQLRKLPQRRYKSKADYTGTFTRPNKEKDRRNGSTKIPAPDPLRIKEKARVMLLSNDPRKRWVNGSTGVVEYIDLENALVSIRLDDSDQIVDVGKNIWKKKEYRYNKQTDEIEPTTVGTFTQYPIMLAWAFTIHKAQSRTLKKIHIDLGHQAFAEGQTYVALSRCTEMKNISMERKLSTADIKVSPEVRRFMKPLTNFEK